MDYELTEVEESLLKKHEEEIPVDIEELIQYFPGYADPFWYERKSYRRKRYHQEYKGEWTVPTNPGTQPDIEIRWKSYPKCSGKNHMIEFFKEWE